MSTIVMLVVKLFAQARQLAGSPQVEIPWTDGQTVLELKRILAAHSPQLSPLIPRLLVAVNDQYCDDRREIAATDEVACFPPVSGG